MRTKLISCLLLLLTILVNSPLALAHENDSFGIGGIEDLNKQIDELKQKISDAQNKEKTLNGEIKTMDSKIKLTTLQLAETAELIETLGEEIDQLGTKIGNLETELSHLSEVLLDRITASYKIQRISYLPLLFSSHGLTDLLTRAKYVQLAQAHDRQVLTQVQFTKDNYSQQKELRENKKAQQEVLKKQLEVQKGQLAGQKAAKQILLEQTRNDEATYQKLLAAARAEYLAIQAILAGTGEEIQVGKVNEGQVIASVIEGSSCNSGGTHLHFIVRENRLSKNPFNYLKGGIDYENCSGTSCNSSDGDPFNPTGEWIWPLEPRITMGQGYGSTWAVRYTWVSQIYSFHNGIDIMGTSLSVKAVKSGTLYRGSYQGTTCRLRYVRVDHDDSDLDSLYLHVNYTL